MLQCQFPCRGMFGHCLHRLHRRAFLVYANLARRDKKSRGTATREHVAGLCDPRLRHAGRGLLQNVGNSYIVAPLEQQRAGSLLKTLITRNGMIIAYGLSSIIVRRILVRRQSRQSPAD